MDEAISTTVLAESEPGRVGLKPDTACLVGVDPIEMVIMMEDHDGAYYAWKQAGISGKILVHIDAHPDWDWISDKDPRKLLQARSLTQVESMLEDRDLWNLTQRTKAELVHIGNYISPALQEGVVKEFYWIVPDAFTKDPRRYRAMVQTFQRMMTVNPRGNKNLRVEHNRIITEIDGNQLITCSLSDLPLIHEPVLLDIDTDFLMPESHECASPSSDLWKQLPWIWPDELVQRLRHKRVRTDFVTIAYSVQGGFTPLSYKYLGDELALRLKHPQLTQRHQELMTHKRRGAYSRHENELDRAITEYEMAVVLEPEDASSHFNLAYLYDKRGSFDQAAARYCKAVQLDPTYATAYNNFGPVFHTRGIHERAQEEYQRILRWDPRNVDAQYGLAELLAHQERWEDATRLYRTVIKLRPDHVEAHGRLGYVYARRDMWDEAITQFRRVIALQPQDGFGHFWLGEVYKHERRYDEAIEAYRTALRCGLRIMAVHRGLGDLYLRKRQLHKALKQYRKGLRLWGWSTLLSIQERFRMLFEKLSRERQPCSS